MDTHDFVLRAVSHVDMQIYDANLLQNQVCFSPSGELDSLRWKPRAHHSDSRSVADTIDV
jgi:hypothetical protein